MASAATRVTFRVVVGDSSHPRSLLRGSSSLLENLRYCSRDPREQTHRQTRHFSDCLRSPEIGWLVSRRVRFWSPPESATQVALLIFKPFSFFLSIFNYCFININYDDV
ncbi:hypothetical protein OIU79_003681 [Salix purpurea]|uniref:Uncharacterized protein n=1 Tax=Salix purpurea TaxID=77065 RepID=A0A9Q0Z8M1_SALPP|nr:hypothetical protein OIU79_003681 [Salix purpurea]